MTGGTADEVAAQAPRTLAEAVYRQLRMDILWGQLAPGSALRSDELRARYAIGVSPLREALSRLAAERLVTTVGQRGFRVASLTADDVRDTMETRVVIEAAALRQAIGNGGIEWETEIVASLHALSLVKPPRKPGPEAEQWAGLHRNFHLALVGACGSRWQTEFAALLFDQAERHRILAHMAPEARHGRDRSVEHQAIAEAVLSRDADAAVEALTRHYRLTAEQVVKEHSRCGRFAPSSESRSIRKTA